MREDRNAPEVTSAEEVIAAFDRERDEANELNRRHTEQVRAARANDRPVRQERRRSVGISSVTN